MPYILPVREVLRSCRTTAEAVALMRRLPPLGKGMNFVVVDASGDARAIEKLGPFQAERPAVGGFAAVTNHFLSPARHFATAPVDEASVHRRPR